MLFFPRNLGIHAVLLDRHRKARLQCGWVDASVYDLDQAMETIIKWREKKGSRVK